MTTLFTRHLAQCVASCIALGGVLCLALFITPPTVQAQNSGTTPDAPHIRQLVIILDINEGYFDGMPPDRVGLVGWQEPLRILPDDEMPAFSRDPSGLWRHVIDLPLRRDAGFAFRFVFEVAGRWVSLGPSGDLTHALLLDDCHDVCQLQLRYGTEGHVEVIRDDSDSFDDFERVYGAMDETRTRSPMTYFLALKRLARGDSAGADAAYREFRRYRPQTGVEDQYSLLVAERFVRQGRVESALNYLMALVEEAQTPASEARVALFAGLVLERADRRDEAIEHYRRMLDAYRDVPEMVARARIQLARLLQQGEIAEKEEGVRLLEKWLRLGYAHLGDTLMLSLERDSAGVLPETRMAGLHMLAAAYRDGGMGRSAARLWHDAAHSDDPYVGAVANLQRWHVLIEAGAARTVHADIASFQERWRASSDSSDLGGGRRLVGHGADRVLASPGLEPQILYLQARALAQSGEVDRAYEVALDLRTRYPASRYGSLLRTVMREYRPAARGDRSER